MSQLIDKTGHFGELLERPSIAMNAGDRLPFVDERIKTMSQ
jgi:hypothetical protein